jgi:hypothetical protein
MRIGLLLDEPTGALEASAAEEVLDKTTGLGGGVAGFPENRPSNSKWRNTDNKSACL